MNSERKLLFMKKHRSLNVISGPLLFLVVLLVLAPIIEFKQAAAIATIFWMGLWWVLRPVNIAVTSLLPIPLNAIFGMVPMEVRICRFSAAASGSFHPAGRQSVSPASRE